MLENQQELQKYIDTIIEMSRTEGNKQLTDVLTNAINITANQSYSDNWNGGRYYFTIEIRVSIQMFHEIGPDFDAFLKDQIKDKFSLLLKSDENLYIQEILFLPITSRIIKWSKISHLFSRDGLLKAILELKQILIAVSTGEKRIQDINDKYKSEYTKTKNAFITLNIANPNIFSDLWEWYTYWSNKDNKLSTYASRRVYINGLFEDLLYLIEENKENPLAEVMIDLTGWDKINHSVELIKSAIASASSVEQYQAVGMHCREAIISLAQTVFKPEKHHNTSDIDKISKNDAKRMLNNYIGIELKGGSYDDYRRYTNSSIDLANNLTHKRTAELRDASICVISTFSLINLIGVIEGKNCNFKY